MATAVDRMAEIASLGVGGMDLAALVATVVYLGARAADDALELFDVLMTNDLLARAQRESKSDKARRYPQVSKDAGTLAPAVSVLLDAAESDTDVSLEAIWEAIEQVVTRAELRAAVTNLAEVAPAPGADPDAEWRASLVERYGVVRRFLPKMCATIDFGATASSRWADPRAQLLAGPAWEAARGPVLNALRLPEDPDGLLAEHARDLDDALHYLVGRLAISVDVAIDADGRLHAAKIEAIADPPSLTALRERCEAMVPLVDIGEMVLEVMSWVPGFVDAFTAVSGGRSRLADLAITIAAALTAQALNVGYIPVISPGVTALTRARISHVDQTYLRAENYATANGPLVEAQAGIALAQTLGGGLVAAVDGIRFVVPVRSVDARPNPKYFGRRRGPPG